MDYLTLGCRLLLGAVFLISGGSKVAGADAYASFRRSLRDMRLVPEPLVRPMGAVVIAAELSISLLLAIPSTVVVGFALAVALTAALTLAVVAVIQRQLAVRCACFGPTGSRLGWHHVVRNGALIAIAGTGLVGGLTAGAGSVHPAGVALAGLAALVGAALVVRFDDLAVLFSR